MTTILGLPIPEGQSLYFWSVGQESGSLLFAANYDEAYAKCIAARVESDPEHSLENAVRWFSKNDTLEEVGGEIDNAPHPGPFPEDGEE